MSFTSDHTVDWTFWLQEESNHTDRAWASWLRTASRIAAAKITWYILGGKKTENEEWYLGNFKYEAIGSSSSSWKIQGEKYK
jgi:hypothetical protein